jgi:putative peptidoglycan lipid II flippase
MAALPLLISPYMMVWFSQLNKDSFALAGGLLFTYGWLRLINIKSDCNGELSSLSLCVLGIFLMWIVRPYLNQLFIPVCFVIIAVTFLCKLKSRFSGWRWISFSVSAACVLICLYMMKGGAASDKTIDDFRRFLIQNHSQVFVNECLDNISAQNWQSARFVPNFVDGSLRGMIGQRCLILSIIGSHDNDATQNSFIDIDKFPSSSLESLAYLPRAALLGVFAPWPDRWSYIFNHQFSFFYTIVPLEAVLLYVGLIGLVLWIFRSLAWSSLVPIFFSVSVMTAYGMATPFIGALYRYRYPWWILLICISLAASLELATCKLRNK